MAASIAAEPSGAGPVEIALTVGVALAVCVALALAVGTTVGVATAVWSGSAAKPSGSIRRINAPPTITPRHKRTPPPTKRGVRERGGWIDACRGASTEMLDA